MSGVWYVWWDGNGYCMHSKPRIGWVLHCVLNTGQLDQYVCRNPNINEGIRSHAIMIRREDDLNPKIKGELVLLIFVIFFFLSIIQLLLHEMLGYLFTLPILR